MKKLLYATLAAPILGILFVAIHVYILYNQTYSGPEIKFKISSGDTFANINSRLYKEGIISNPRIFHYLNRYRKTMDKYKAGTYIIPTGLKMEDVYKTLLNGNPVIVSITIPEGKNIYEIAKLYEEAGLSTKSEIMKIAFDRNFVESLGIPHNSVEGYLYPETYKFSPDSDAKTILKTMFNEFRKKTDNLNLNNHQMSVHEIVTLASIVEKETGASIERPMIAGVFFNRLRKKMRLQSDPTTIYGMFENYNGNIKKSDLLNKTPYNTYVIPALPPGPIANPGILAIKAVLNPEAHEYLYFVSNNDGTHTFSKTYGEHNNHVENFQRNKKAREGKSWRDLKE